MIIEQEYLERIVVKSAGHVTLINVEEVDWIEAAGVHVHLHVGGETHLHRASVTQLLQRLDPRLFVRVHRCAAVNPARIRELQPRTRGDYTVILADGTELMLSRSYRPGLERWLRQKL
jgi:two-component system LytT family response regulator